MKQKYNSINTFLTLYTLAFFNNGKFVNEMQAEYFNNMVADDPHSSFSFYKFAKRTDFYLDDDGVHLVTQKSVGEYENRILFDRDKLPNIKTSEHLSLIYNILWDNNAKNIQEHLNTLIVCNIISKQHISKDMTVRLYQHYAHSLHMLANSVNTIKSVTDEAELMYYGELNKNKKYVRFSSHPLTDSRGEFKGTYRYDIGSLNDTLQEAIDAGLKYYGCDDFLIGVYVDGNAVGINYMEHPRDVHQEELDTLNFWSKGLFS